MIVSCIPEQSAINSHHWLVHKVEIVGEVYTVAKWLDFAWEVIGTAERYSPEHLTALGWRYYRVATPDNVPDSRLAGLEAALETAAQRFDAIARRAEKNNNTDIRLAAEECARETRYGIAPVLTCTPPPNTADGTKHLLRDTFGLTIATWRKNMWHTNAWAGTSEYAYEKGWRYFRPVTNTFDKEPAP